MIEGSTPFLERAHKVVLALGVASLLFGLVWAVVVDDGDSITTHDANGYSRSSIGFRALGELLEAHGVPIVHSRYRSPQRCRAGDVLVLAAPEVKANANAKEQAHDEQILDEALEGGHRVLLILPKWRVARHPLGDEEPPPFPKQLRRVDVVKVLELVKRFDVAAELVNVPTDAFALNAFSLVPQGAPFQLLRTDGLTPLISGDDGILVGERREGEGRIVVLADPDVVSNGGLAQGENAALALALIDALRGDGGTVVFDETLHGFERTPSIWRELGRPPLKQGSAHLLLLCVATVVAGAVRFATPRRIDGGWREGKQALLDNTAELMELVGHAPAAVGRYLEATLESLTEALHAPSTLDRRGRVDWLAARLQPRQRDELAALSAVVVAPGGAATTTSRRTRRAALREVAARIHRFREEVLHGAR